MKGVLAVATIATLVASPAFAQSAFDSQRRNPTASYEVYMGNKRLGQDPDPNVRFEMRRDNYGQK
jgi:hypothetical protein